MTDPKSFSGFLIHVVVLRNPTVFEITNSGKGTKRGQLLGIFLLILRRIIYESCLHTF